MSTYFTDFSSDTIGTLPTGWVTNDASEAEVTADGLRLTTDSGARFSTVWYETIPLSGVTEVYTQFLVGSVSSWHEGVGAAVSKSDSGYSTNTFAATYAGYSSTQLALTQLYSGGVLASGSLPSAIDVSGNKFNALLQITGPVIGLGAYTINGWFWREGDTAKTSADTPDRTYSGTFGSTALSNTYAAFFSDQEDIDTSTLTKFGLGINGDAAPQSGSGSSSITADATLSLGGIGIDASAEAERNDVTASAALALGGLGMAGTGAATASITADATLSLGGIGIDASAEAERNDVTASAALALGGLGMAGTGAATASITADATLSLGGIGIDASAEAERNDVTASGRIGAWRAWDGWHWRRDSINHS
ncbi:MAG: hypothetical protein U5M23_01295 [Marinagarivorans sp.]|nr:hypothetical protein [Marinagarivorans sp.]